VAALEGTQVVDGHDRVRVPGRPVGDVDDHRLHDQLRRLQVGGQPPSRGEVPGRVDVGPDVLDDGPFLHVVPVVLERGRGLADRLLTRREGRDRRLELVGQVTQPVPPA
jgi:hypothetical protein